MIALASEQDLASIAGIEKQLFSRPWTEEHFHQALCNPAAKLWVSKDEENVVCGYVCMYCSVDEGEITNVAVNPQYQRRGYAGALLEVAKQHIIDTKLQRIILEVRVSNENAISLYQKQGFENLGIRKGFYEDPKEDAIIMAWENLKC